MSYKVAVAGATGNVGREILRILAERAFPASRVTPLASARSAGTTVPFGDGEPLTVGDLETFDFSGTDIVLASPGAQVSARFAPVAAAAGAVVIDNSSHFRMDPDVPLVVPEVNPQALDGWRKRGIVANPNCSTIQLVTAVKPLHDAAGIRRMVVASYQSVSGAGREAMDELFAQTRGVYTQQETAPRKFPAPIAFNIIPQIDVFLEDGSTKEEWKIVAETGKILDPAIRVSATCARVPVFVGHAEAVHLELERPLDAAEARRILAAAPGVTVLDDRRPGGYATPKDCAGQDDVYVSRIRRDDSVANGLALWVVADNLRKGAALNAIQIAETMIARKLL